MEGRWAGGGWCSRTSGPTTVLMGGMGGFSGEQDYRIAEVVHLWKLGSTLANVSPGIRPIRWEPVTAGPRTTAQKSHPRYPRHVLQLTTRRLEQNERRMDPSRWRTQTGKRTDSCVTSSGPTRP